MHEQQRLATVVGRRLTGHVISDRIAFALKVVMLARIPARLLPRIGDMFEVAEPPNDIAVPIDLNQIGLILKTMRWVAQPGAAKHLTVRQQFVRKALQAAPQLNFATVHIDQQGTEIRRWKNRVPIPRFAGVVHGDARWIDRRMAHTLLARQAFTWDSQMSIDLDKCSRSCIWLDAVAPAVPPVRYYWRSGAGSSQSRGAAKRSATEALHLVAFHSERRS